VPKRTSTRHYASSFLMCDRSFARNLFCCKSIACAAFVDVESTFLELSEGQLRAHRDILRCRFEFVRLRDIAEVDARPQMAEGDARDP
jgi:hypothetical protein